MNARHHALPLSVAAGVLAWLLDAAAGCVLFDGGSLMGCLVLDLSPADWVRRIAVLVLFTVLGVILSERPEEEEPEEEQASGAREAVNRLLGVLSDRERLIVTRHYGLTEAGRKQTLEQIGHLLGVTKERVRQLEQRALHKLRDAAGEAGLGLQG